jgi:hypothetical protein
MATAELVARRTIFSAWANCKGKSIPRVRPLPLRAAILDLSHEADILIEPFEST